MALIITAKDKIRWSSATDPFIYVLAYEILTDEETMESAVALDLYFEGNYEKSYTLSGNISVYIEDSENSSGSVLGNYLGAFSLSNLNIPQVTANDVYADSVEGSGLIYHDSTGETLLDGYVTVSLRGSLTDANGTSYTIYENILIDADNIIPIPKPTSVICSPAYLGETATITVIPGRSNYIHTISYVFGEFSGTIATKTSTLTHQLPIPEEFLTQFAADETVAAGTITCISYAPTGNVYNDMEVGTSTCNLSVLISADMEIAPQFLLTVEDTNTVASALTGSSSKFIRYFSNPYVNSNVAVQYGSTLKYIAITWGSQVIYAANGTFNAIETDNFKIEATDSRGFTSILPVTYTGDDFVPYTKLSCNLFPEMVTIDGDLSFVIEGNYFNESFGAANNSLVVQYRYRSRGSDFGDWITLEGTPKASSYKYEATITGLNYREFYGIQARAIDEVMTATTPELSSASFPVFDWCGDNFNFNVPVYNQENQVFAEGKAIYGTDSYGSETVALTPKDSIGNTVLGYGNYQANDGDTMIYGNNVHIFSNNDVTVNDVSLIGDSGIGINHLIRALANSYDFTTTVSTLGTNYSTASCSMTLRGNCLYCRVYGSRSAASGTGDITDELIAKFTFNHGGKITGMDYVSAVTGSSGPTAAFSMINPTVSGNTASFEIYLANSAAAGRNFLAAFVIPVSIDLTKFTA